MAFPSLPASHFESTNPAKDVIPITASATKNVFGNDYNPTNGGDSRACRSLLASADMTITCITATGQTRTAVPLVKGINPIQVIQVSSISTGTLWALI